MSTVACQGEPGAHPEGVLALFPAADPSRSGT